MQNKFKGNAVSVAIVAALVGHILNRVLTSYFGEKATFITLAVVILIVLCTILIYIFKSQYLVAIKSFMMIIPIIIGGIGLYVDNLYLASFGLLSTFIIAPILKKMDKSRDK